MNDLHYYTQRIICDTLHSLGYNGICEYKGNGWRADVYVEVGDKKYAFEVQTSPQTLQKTLERQSLYLRDGITCCWLFEKEPAKQRLELEDLPVFRIIDFDQEIYVSLKGRKQLLLSEFVADFVLGKIKFCHYIKPLPFLRVNFVEFSCWSCGSINHIYYLSPLQTACNIEMTPEESLWANEKFSMDSRIVKAIEKEVQQMPNIHMAKVGKRYSHTVRHSYLSFGCSDCDAIFGDFYVHDTIIDSFAGDGVEATITIPIDFDLGQKQELPHWCHPGDGPFCEE